MGFTIISIILIIISSVHDNEITWCIFSILGATAGVALILIVGLTFTYNTTGYSKQGLLKEKEKLEFYLDQKDKYFFDYLSKAKMHNEIVEIGNNKWYRWSIEDRSEYMIDVEYYQSSLLGDE